MEFVNQTRRQHKLILGIGHRVKSVGCEGLKIIARLFNLYTPIIFQINNPDMRVAIIRDYVQKHFSATPILSYALEVEKITTAKVTWSHVIVM